MLQPARTIWLHEGAPPKPAVGAACNGCGLCCAAEPCPLGMAISRARGGRCLALAWDEGLQRYRCGALIDARRWLGRLPGAAALARRWISAGTGCDCDLEPDRG